MGTRGEWAKSFLNALGNNNPDDKTINLVSAWTVGEGTEARFNPLATTLDYGTNTKFNTANVRNYETRQQGIEASVLTLRGKWLGYSDIIKGLASNKPEDALAAMKICPWGTNFVHVEIVYRSRDVRGEQLESEANVPNHTPEVIRPADYNNGGSGINPMGPEGRTNAPIVETTPGVNADSVQKYVKIAFGSVLAIISGALFIMVAVQSDAGKSAVSIAKVAAVL